MEARRRLGPERTIRRLGCLVRGAALCLALASFACSGAPFEVIVTFPGPVDVEPGAPVVYQGIEVGVVDDVSLHQSSPRESGRVALTLQIQDRSVVLREGDRFEIASGGVLGDPAIRITPAPADSNPMHTGAVVEGVPPAVTRMRESVADALESLSEAAAQAADDVAAELSRSFGVLSFEGPPPSADDFAYEDEGILLPDDDDETEAPGVPGAAIP